MLTFVVALPLCIWYLHHTVSSLACDAKIPPGPTEMYLISCTFKSARTQGASDKLESEKDEAEKNKKVDIPKTKSVQGYLKLGTAAGKRSKKHGKSVKRN